MSDESRKTGQQHSGGTATEEKVEVKRPSLYKVLLLNDDYTTMEFVVHVLRKFFNKAAEEAQSIMLQVHYKGIGVCGFYPREIAETKVQQVIGYAQQQQHPLQCTMEEA